MKQIAISAAEDSGDLLASELISAFRSNDELEFFGLGGQKMRQAGCRVLWDSSQVCVMGIVEVVKKLPKLIKLRKQITQTLLTKKPDLFIGVDAPDFNLLIEKILKQHGIKTAHFVSPSLWAWRPNRAKLIKKSSDLILCLFPFEVDFYKQWQIPAVFVGHPLVKKTKFRENHQKTNRVLLMPGSRWEEIKRILPMLLSTLPLLLAQNPQLKFSIVLANNKYRHWVSQQADSSGINISFEVASAYEQLTKADLVLLASGTATLEAALIGTPMVVVHILPKLSYLFVKPLLKTKWVSLPNIILQKSLVPELLQNTASASNISKVSTRLLSGDNIELINQFKHIRKQLCVDSLAIIRKHILELVDG